MNLVLVYLCFGAKLLREDLARWWVNSFAVSFFDLLYKKNDKTMEHAESIGAQTHQGPNLKHKVRPKSKWTCQNDSFKRRSLHFIVENPPQLLHGDFRFMSDQNYIWDNNGQPDCKIISHDFSISIEIPMSLNQIETGWWFQPLRKLFVNWDNYSQYMGM